MQFKRAGIFVAEQSVEFEIIHAGVNEQRHAVAERIHVFRVGQRDVRREGGVTDLLQFRPFVLHVENATRAEPETQV